MKENSYLQTKNYFENLADQSNFLNDFVGFFQREWATATASVKGLQSPILALFKYENGFEGPDHNTIAVRKIGFAIMFNDVAADDYDAQYNAISEAERLSGKVLARLRYDNYQQDHFLYNSFLKETVEISPVELSGNEFGVEVLFSLKNKQSLVLIPDDWKDIDQVCP